MEPIRCPKCGSTDVTYMNMDGHVMTDQYGYDILLDIAPDIWRCEQCGELFWQDVYEEAPHDSAD